MYFASPPLSPFLPLPFPYQLREGVRRNALQVLRPKSPHSEEIAQYIEWRDPCGHAAVWLQGSTVQGRYDRLYS